VTGSLKTLDANLQNPDELITMKDNEALLVHGNKRPVRYRLLPYFKHWRFRQFAKLPPAPLPFNFIEKETDDDLS